MNVWPAARMVKMPSPNASSAITAPAARNLSASSQKSGSPDATIQRCVASDKLMNMEMPNDAYQTPTTRAIAARPHPAIRDGGISASVCGAAPLTSGTPATDRLVCPRGRINHLDQLHASSGLPAVGGRHGVLTDRPDEILDHALMGAGV